MSCQIKGIANLTNTSNIKEVLFGDSIRQCDIPSNELPLQDCFISLSSAGDILVMAYNAKMIILISRWDSLEPDETKTKFHMIWYGEVAKEPNEWITSVICLPLLSLGKASSGPNPDWTCIIVGFNTGFVRFYTETGALLLGEQLHNETVIGLKCQSLRSAKHAGDNGLAEELHVIYNSVVCVLQGFPLFSTLRACRNHLARVQANCDDLPPITTLSYKKWGYKNQDIINDSEVIGTTSVNSFDHLMTASICGGYNASYRSSAPQHSLVIATGKRPFIGFHYALEGSAAPVLSDVAIAMASKLANAIGTAVPWFPLNWGNSNSKHQTSFEVSKTTAHEPIEQMTCRFGLSDVTREGYSIVSSPNKMLSVIADIMGRVILIDNRHGIAMRMWKGYRDAQCGWIEAEEEKHSGANRACGKFKQASHLRTALFLVIYAPKKGVIEIWSTQQGPKITTFTASKHGRLLYINYGLFGTNDNIHLPKNKPQYSCVFMDPLGGLKEITVPFHFALNSKNGKRARDIHLLKKLKTFLREEEFDEEKLVSNIHNVCTDLKTNEIRVQTIEMLMTNKNVTPDALLTATNCFIKKLDEYDKEEMEHMAKTLYLLTMQLQQAIQFYKYIRSNIDSPGDHSFIADIDEPTSKDLASILLTSELEIHRILKLSNTISSFKCRNIKMENKVKFKEDGKIFLDFLFCFEFGTVGSINIKKDLKTEKKFQISRLMYEGCIYSNNRIETWREAAVSSNIEPLVLMEFALVYWINKKTQMCLRAELKQFTQLVNAICSIANVEEICAKSNEISLWWKNVRNILSDSTNPFNALSAALACRAVAMSLEKYKEKCVDKTQDNNGIEKKDVKNENDLTEVQQVKDSVSDLKLDNETYNLTSEWENVTKDSCQFTLLIGNLEDITILDAIVSQPPPFDTTTQFFALSFVKFDISLGSVLSRGKGSVSEIVAKWISSTGIDPTLLVDTTDIEFHQMQLTNDSSEVINSLDEDSNVVDALQQDPTKYSTTCNEIDNKAKEETSASICILEQITLLKRHFPYSLTSSILLANLCWEFAMSWNKDVSQLHSLEAALFTLRQIPMKHMRHGVCCLLWSVHIKKRMEAIAKLMNKLGKLPKKRLCVQEVGLSDEQSVTFLLNCVTFFEIFIDSEVLQVGENAMVKLEEIWEGCSSGPQPFAALAISQTPAWYDLIILHVQIANVLYMMAHFNLKVTKPLNSLFESVVQPYFFQTITDKVMFTWYRDDKRDSVRSEFLRRVITASMDVIHEETTDAKTSSSIQAIQWMSKCQTLASIWKINNDQLRIHQVCQLYVNGFDRLAEEVVTAVNDVENLGANLLPIAGRRVVTYLSRTPDLLEEVSRISPALTKYLESFDVPDVICTNCSNYDTIELIRRISRYLPETHSDYHLVQFMLDATFIYEGAT